MQKTDYGIKRELIRELQGLYSGIKKKKSISDTEERHFKKKW